MRPRKGENPFTVTERILLYLGEHRVARQWDVPPSVTQEGISHALGVRRSNTARALVALARKRKIFVGRARALGRKNTSNFYQLSAAGERDYSALLKIARCMNVEIHTPGGRREMPLTEIPGLIPAGGTLFDVAVSVRFGKLDISALGARRISRSPGGHLCKGVPEPGHFIGREGERERADAWWRKHSSQILVVTGMGGMGKTAFLAKISSSWRNSSHTLWVSMRGGGTSGRLTDELTHFLAHLGRYRAMAVVSSNFGSSAEICRVLSHDMANLKMTLFIDDVHQADRSFWNIMPPLAETLRSNPGLKIVLAGRVSGMTREGMGLAGMNVEVLEMGPLDKDASRRLLARRGLYNESIVAACKGYPILLTTVRHEVGLAYGDVAKYLDSEILGDLTPEDTALMGLLAVSRNPISMKALSGPLGVAEEAIETLLARGLARFVSDDLLEVHDILTEHLLGHLPRSELERLHSRLGWYYLSSIGISSGLEAIHHLCKAGNWETAAVVFRRMAGELASKGIVRGLEDVATEMGKLMGHSDSSMLVSIGRVFFHLGRWAEAEAKILEGEALAREMGLAKVQGDALCAMGELYLKMGQNEKAMESLMESVKIAKDTRNIDLEAKGHYLLGSAMEARRPSEAEAEFDRVMRMAESRNLRRASALALYGKGRIEERRGRLGYARRYKERALKLLEGQDEGIAEAKIRISLGVNAFAARDINGALECFSGAIDLARRIGNVPLEGVALANIGAALIEKPDYVKAEMGLTKAVEILAGIGDFRTLTRAHNNLTLVHLKRGMHEKALEQARASLAVARRLGNQAMVARSLLFVSIASDACGMRSESMAGFERAIALAKESGDTRLLKEIKEEFCSIGGALNGPSTRRPVCRA